MSLDQQTAIKRADIIRKGSIKYNFHIILQTKKYHGLAQVTFYLESLKSVEDNIEIDFSGKSVESLIINNLQAEIERSQNFILLPKAYLQKGRNRVSIMYQNQYDLDQLGIITYFDNNEQFVFTDFEPYFANRVFPCFDQPDLKATMKLTVVGPKSWKILSNQTASSIQQFEATPYVKASEWEHENSRHLLQKFANKITNQDTQITIFPQTKLLPTYILCFTAGNYKEIKNTTITKVPMSLYCTPLVQEKLSKYSDFIFEVTIKCMDLFATKFGVPYPFNKYDQVFIRQFSALAMQNAGIVTFDQSSMLPREKATIYQYYYLALVVSHELSHHWFGNYVTMTWWDDLWLNESFAQWMSCYSLEQLKTNLSQPFESSYMYFRDGKTSGYKQDERNNATHPIRGIVSNTDEAFSTFDGITYQKGASALKQLTYLVGQDNFFTGLQKYFQRFAWDNATINDLLADISNATPDETIDLQAWKKTWLQQPSLNVFSVDWDRVNYRISINQRSFDNSNILRLHKIKIALFKQDCTYDVLNNVEIKPIETTSISYASQSPMQYKAILINYEDHTFAENIIDPVSLQFFKKNIDKIDVKDVFTKLMIWYNIRSMVNLSFIYIFDYVNLIQNKLFKEPSNFILEKILQNLFFYLNNFIDDNVGKSYKSIMVKSIKQALIGVSDLDTQRVQILQDFYIEYSHTESEINSLWSWLEGNDADLMNRKINKDQQWQVVRKIFTLPIDPLNKWPAYYQVGNNDTDLNRVQQNTAIVYVLLADLQKFQDIYNQFKSSTISLSEKYIKIKGWWNEYHYDWIVSKYQNRFYDDIVALSETLSYEQFQFFYEYLRPIDSNLSYQIQKYQQVIGKLEDIGDLQEHCRNLRKIVDDLTLRAQNVNYNIDINTALTQQRAFIRYSYIELASLSYNYHISFTNNETYYEGMAQITFTLTQIPSILPLECVCDTINVLNVNGTQIVPVLYGEFIHIPSNRLIKGKNFISIYYRSKYNNDGIGCMFYTQTVQTPNKHYVYTNFQPYGAHRFVPCFDQPDLRARASFNVIVPQGWLAVGNESDSYNDKFSIIDYELRVPTNDRKLLESYLSTQSGNFYILPPTKPLSTYLYCIVAGEYYKLTATSAQTYNNIPMSLFCISSYSNRLNGLAPFIFQMTRLSLQLFQTIFQTPYPFNKYDSIFCHQYKPGAMQNPGIITFKDTYLYPQVVSLEKMLSFAATIIHQCSHNWFGNLVTMKWWDDLWLNQSFADFIANYGLQYIKDKVTTISKYDSGWKIYLVKGVSGYLLDQITQTTHAVRSNIHNTSVATTYFDSITYQKGSATLKQLMFLMGQQSFFTGLKDYFQQFGWKNATIDDFLNKMQQYFPKSVFTLDDWKESWLLTPSLNTFSVSWNPSNLSPTAQLIINQSYYSPTYPYLRYHKTKVGFFKSDLTYDIKQILISPTSTTILQYDGTNNYQAILLNVDYQSYFKYTIDPASLSFFQKNINNISNVVTRTLIWHDINEQVRDQNYKLANFVNIFLNFINLENDDRIFEFQYSFIRLALNSFIPIGQRSALKSQIFDAVYNQLKTQTGIAENRVILLKDQLSYFASTSAQVKSLQEWRTNNNPDLKSYPITVSQAWQVVKLVYSQDNSVYNQQIKDQTYKDQLSKSPGIQAQLTRNTCDALIADSTKMQEIYQYFKAMSLSLDVKLSFVEGWNNMVHLNELQTIYKAKYFNDLLDMSRQLIGNHFEFFYQNLKPIDDNLQETIDLYKTIFLQGSDMIGNMRLLTQIKYNYELRQKLYIFNS